MINYKIKSGDVDLQVYSSEVKSDTTLLFMQDCLGKKAWTMIMKDAMQKLILRYHCVFFDQRGCGLSEYDLKKGIALEDMAQDIYTLIKDTRSRYPCKKIILCAESIGAFITLLTLNDYIEWVDGFILCSPILQLTNASSQDLYSQIKEVCYKKAPHEFKKMMMLLEDKTASQFFANQHVQQWIYSNKNMFANLQYIAAMSSWLFTNSVKQALHDMTVPTLIMQGSNEMIEREGHVLNTLIQLKNPFIIYEAFPLSTTCIYEDQELEFVARIKRFLKEEFYYSL